jgi:hypothetical protein
MILIIEGMLTYPPDPPYSKTSSGRLPLVSLPAPSGMRGIMSQQCLEDGGCGGIGLEGSALLLVLSVVTRQAGEQDQWEVVGDIVRRIVLHACCQGLAIHRPYRR